MDRLARCRRELVALKKLWDSGHPDRRGIWMAIEDWIWEESLIMQDAAISKIDHLVSEHDIFCQEARDLMVKKNADYANEDDPFRNFRAFGRFGILVRLSDKVARLQSLLENGKAEVSGETIRDTCVDITNYSFLFEHYEELEDMQPHHGA